MWMTSKQAPEHHSFGSDGAPLPWGKWSAVTGPSSVQGRHLPPLGCCTAWRPLPLSSKQLTPSRGPSHERRAVESSQERAPELDRPVCRRRTALRWQASRGGGEATFPMPLAPKKVHETFFLRPSLIRLTIVSLRPVVPPSHWILRVMTSPTHVFYRRRIVNLRVKNAYASILSR